MLDGVCVARLRAERGANLLVERGGHADVGREGIEHAAERMEVVGKPIAGHRLDQHQRAVGLERLRETARKGADFIGRAGSELA